MTKKQKHIQTKIRQTLYKRASMAIVALFAIGFGGYFAVASAITDNSGGQTAPVVTPEAKAAAKAKAAAAAKNTTATQAAASAAAQTAAKNASAIKAAAKSVTPAASPATAAKPAAVASTISRGTALYVVPEKAAAINQAAASAATASDAAVLNRLANQPTAQWFGDWNSDVRGGVNQAVTNARGVGRVAVLVAYNIPNRDCGGESAGGSGSGSAYGNWIRQFAAGVAGRSTIVILEPDATAADCFNTSRAAMLSDAAGVLQANGATVYIDAGNANWRSSADMANRLRQSGVANASGFSLNVSNFQTTGSNISFGTSLSNQIGGKHFVIDTSRNGNGPTPDYQWCNPAGRALGQAPTTQTGYSLVDAFLWVKVPGESDGRCGPAIGGSQPPAAGQFWPEYALMLARNAGW